jgi:hypothetical protein
MGCEPAVNACKGDRIRRTPRRRAVTNRADVKGHIRPETQHYATAQERPMTDLGKFVVFKPVAGGHVYRRPAAWLLGSSQHYLVNEEQKAAIRAILTRSTRPVLWTAGISWVALSALSGAALSLWSYRSGFHAPGLDGFIAMLAMVLSIYPAFFVISRQVLLRRLRPILATLPPTDERITSREEREAMEAIAKAEPAATLSPARRRIVTITGLLAIAGPLAGMISRAIDMHAANQSKLLTFYLANANFYGLLNIVTIVAMGFLSVNSQRNANRKSR